jgi:hypothetical protein
MKDTRSGGSLNVFGTSLNLLGLILGVAAAYSLTTRSLKIELAAETEGTAVQRLGKKPAEIEVILKEGVISRQQFFEFSEKIERRPGGIEFYLTDQSGEEIGRKN